MELKSGLAGFATLATIGLFLTGIPVVRRIRQVRSSESVAYFPYIAGVLNGVLWLKYGLLVDDFTVIFVNGVGACLNTYYVVICYLYSKTPSQYIPSVTSSFGFLVLVMAYVKFAVPVLEDAIYVVGLIACGSTVLLFGSPLSTVGTVWRTRSTESMVFSLCVMNFVVSVTWSLYGYVLQDAFIHLPNAFGALLSLLQLLLFAKFPSSGGPGHRYDIAARLI